MFDTRPEIVVEGLQPVVGLRVSSGRDRRAAVSARLRERVRTTPGRLTLMSILALAGALCFGVAATLSEASRARAAESVRTQTEPLLAQAVGLYTALSDANATATTTFLTGGLEPPARRARYLEDLRLATASLSGLTRAVAGPPAARAAVGSIADQLPLYSGLVEAARAGNRQNFPVGAAYMRQASTRLTGTVLPAANQLFDTEARQLTQGYTSGTSASAPVALAIVGLVALGLLVAVQIYLARISRRILNLPILLATVVLIGTCGWALVALSNEQDALATAQRNGSDSVEVLSATRVLVSRAQTDQSLALVNRGSDLTDPLDFTKVLGLLAPPSGLVGELARLDQRTGTAAAARVSRDFNAYRAQAARIAELHDAGELPAAAALAASPTTAAIEDRLSGDLGRRAQAAQQRFERAAADAGSSLSGLTIAIPLLTALAAALVLIGLQMRLGEYR